LARTTLPRALYVAGKISELALEAGCQCGDAAHFQQLLEIGTLHTDTADVPVDHGLQQLMALIDTVSPDFRAALSAVTGANTAASLVV
jgi:hypothetical protein